MMSDPAPKTTPRVLLMRNSTGIFCVIADRDVEVFEVDLGVVDDRVYQLSVDGMLIISAVQVDEMLATETVSHGDDGCQDLALQPLARLRPN